MNGSGGLMRRHTLPGAGAVNPSDTVFYWLFLMLDPSTDPSDFVRLPVNLISEKSLHVRFNFGADLVCGFCDDFSALTRKDLVSVGGLPEQLNIDVQLKFALLVRVLQLLRHPDDHEWHRGYP